MTTRIDDILNDFGYEYTTTSSQEEDKKILSEAKLALRAECLKLLPEKGCCMCHGEQLCADCVKNKIIDEIERKIEEIFL